MSKELNKKELSEISFDMAVFLNMFEGMGYDEAVKEAFMQLKEFRKS